MTDRPACDRWWGADSTSHGNQNPGCIISHQSRSLNRRRQGCPSRDMPHRAHPSHGQCPLRPVPNSGKRGAAVPAAGVIAARPPQPPPRCHAAADRAHDTPTSSPVDDGSRDSQVITPRCDPACLRPVAQHRAENSTRHETGGASSIWVHHDCDEVRWK